MTNDQKRNPGGDGEIVTVSSASAGQKTGHIRYVLGVGLALAIATLAAIYLFMFR